MCHGRAVRLVMGGVTLPEGDRDDTSLLRLYPRVSFEVQPYVLQEMLYNETLYTQWHTRSR